MILKNWGNYLLNKKMNKWHILEMSEPALGHTCACIYLTELESCTGRVLLPIK